MNKVQTINLQGKEYALVPQRLKAFREANPRATIETDPIRQEDGSVIYKATIVADASKEDSPSATGHAYGTLTESKAFEKLETTAVGRALALLGYLNNGQIATTEEMEEYEEYKQSQFEEAVLAIRAADSKDEFKTIISGMTAEQKRLATPIINERIEELKNGNARTSTATK